MKKFQLSLDKKTFPEHLTAKYVNVDLFHFASLVTTSYIKACSINHLFF